MSKVNELEREYKPSLYLDFKDAEEAKEFLGKLSEKVTVVIQGKLTSVRVDANGKEWNSSSIRIEDFKVELVENNVFNELADD